MKKIRYRKYIVQNNEEKKTERILDFFKTRVVVRVVKSKVLKARSIFITKKPRYALTGKVLEYHNVTYRRASGQ